jgi:hypothetical protein
MIFEEGNSSNGGERCEEDRKTPVKMMNRK